MATTIFVVGLLASAVCFFRGASAPIEQTRAIEDIRPGHRVIVDAPAEALATDVARLNELVTSWNASDGSLEIEGVADPLRELNEATPAQLEKADYRLVMLQAKEVWEDGTYNEINVATLQPWQWLHENEVHVGGEAPLPLETVEMNLPVGMTGKVLDILPCPQLERGAGRTVLTTVNRLARGVIELTLRDASGKEETLRPTDEHLFYSASQGAWLSAGELQPGEHLDGVHGLITVAAVTPLEGTHRVYNMTVQGEHLYRVAECGVLVHNNYIVDLTKIVNPDVAKKGLHIKVNGKELTLFVEENVLAFRSTFPAKAGDDDVLAAIRAVTKEGFNNQQQKKLLKDARRSLEMLEQNAPTDMRVGVLDELRGVIQHLEGLGF